LKHTGKGGVVALEHCGWQELGLRLQLQE
jgi:hypothetical protein